MIAGSWRAERDRGVAAAWILFLVAFVSVPMLGLIVDGGGVMATKVKTARAAEQAARLASDQLSVGSVRSGGSAVDPVQADAAVQAYFAGTGNTATVDVEPDGGVSVTVHSTHELAFMRMFGNSQTTVSATADAESIDENDAPS